MSESTNTSERNRIMVPLSDLVVLALWLGIPYVTVGIFWADAHREHLETTYGLDRFLSYLGEVLVWPLLMVADITLR
jgi:hypothetical protein